MTSRDSFEFTQRMSKTTNYFLWACCHILCTPPPSSVLDHMEYIGRQVENFLEKKTYFIRYVPNLGGGAVCGNVQTFFLYLRLPFTSSLVANNKKKRLRVIWYQCLQCKFICAALLKLTLQVFLFVCFAGYKKIMLLIALNNYVL